MIQRNARPLVFLSYSHAEVDQRYISRLIKDLHSQSIDIWIDKESIAPGSPDWEEEVRDGIRASNAVIYAASPTARTSRYVKGELAIAETYRRKIYPVWILGDKWSEAAPLILQSAQYIDIRGALYQQGLKQLIQILTHPGESPRPKLRIQLLPLEPRNPYKGLKPFTVKDTGDFFGRGALVQKMLHEVEQMLLDEQHQRQGSRLLTVIGPSGSGKSSAVMAGLISRLQDGEDILGHKNWICLEPTRPGKHPLDSLAKSLLPHIPGGSFEGVHGELWGESTWTLHRLTKSIAGQKKGRVVLLLDQFEELFTETADRTERRQFIDLLVTAAKELRSQLIIIVTLRADFYDYPMHYLDLHVLMQTHRVEVSAMAGHELREAIERPTQLPNVQVTFEGDLVGDLLFEMRQQENALPLLQFALKQLFDHRDGRLLTVRAYREMGGVSGTLDGHAEATYASLPTDEHRRLARSLFLRLINPGGVEQEATRRRVPSADFALHDAKQDTIMQKTISIFVEARLLTTNTVAGASTLEISHEALISAWERLKDWIMMVPAQQDGRFQQELQHSMEKWEDEGRPEQRLYGDPRYQDALAWVSRNVPNRNEAEFLYLSKLWRQHQKEMRWPRLALISAILLVLAVLIPALSPYFILHHTMVTTLQDAIPGSLRQVIHEAPPGSIITFAPTLHGTILLTSDNLNIAKNITLDGPDPNRITISSGAHGYKIHILSGSSVSFENLSFKDSITQYTAFIYNEGTLTLSGCIVSGNISDYNGGGLSNWGGTLTLNNSMISGNQASGNGAGIFNWNGPLILNNSIVSSNIATRNGGGIYSLRGGLFINHSTVFHNQATSNDGGGIDIVNGELILTDSSQIMSNSAGENGGGLAIVGSRAIMSNSTISHNRADQQSGGLAVERDSENNISSEVTLNNIEVAEHPKNAYYIGENYVGAAPGHLDSRIAGMSAISSTTLQIVSTNTGAVTGSPAPKKPPEYSPQYRGTVDINAFCQYEGYSYGALTEATDTSSGASADVIKCISLSGNQSRDFAPQTICQWGYPRYTSDIVDRLANYYDPSSLQCYSHVTRLGDIATRSILKSYCLFIKDSGGIVLDGTNAYSWKCKPRGGIPVGFSVADACNWYYPNHNAFERLVDFSNPGGWECWAPR